MGEEHNVGLNYRVCKATAKGRDDDAMWHVQTFCTPVKCHMRDGSGGLHARVRMVLNIYNIHSNERGISTVYSV